jgi:hypothetical protein
MQRRYVIGLHPTFQAAKVEKDKVMSENPGESYQIRKKYKNFAVVHRVSTHESEEIIQRAQELYGKRPKKSRRNKRVADYQA